VYVTVMPTFALLQKMQCYNVNVNTTPQVLTAISARKGLYKSLGEPSPGTILINAKNVTAMVILTSANTMKQLLPMDCLWISMAITRAVGFVKSVNIILREPIVTSAILDSKEGLMFL